MGTSASRVRTRPPHRCARTSAHNLPGKADDLDAAGLHTRIGASALTIGGLLKHLAITEDYIFTRKLSGEPVGDPWESLWDGTDDWEFMSAAHDPPDQLYAFWDEAVQRSRARLDAALAQGGLDQLVHVSSDDGEHASLRRLLCDLIEEYGRHTGHADLLREAVDRRVGEDPPRVGGRCRDGQTDWSSGYLASRCATARRRSSSPCGRDAINPTVERPSGPRSGRLMLHIPR